MKFCICETCGKVFVAIKEAPTETICCGKPMREMRAGESDGSVEKHVPVRSETTGCVMVSVGADPHPMTESHHIEWIAVQTDMGFHLRRMKPGSKPVAIFPVCPGEKIQTVYAYCNLHGLWKA